MAPVGGEIRDLPPSPGPSWGHEHHQGAAAVTSMVSRHLGILYSDVLQLLMIYWLLHGWHRCGERLGRGGEGEVTSFNVRWRTRLGLLSTVNMTTCHERRPAV